MTIFPLTPDGVANKLAELYALTNPQLALQAQLVRNDFKAWMLSNFDFTAAQTTYINKMNAVDLDYLGSQCSICFSYRLEIELIYPLPPSPTGYAKYTETRSTVKLSTDNTGATTASGKLTIQMDYKPI